MSDLKPKQTMVNIGGKEYGTLFNLNAIDAIQDRFDVPLSEIDDLLSDERKAYKALRGILAILINEAIDDAETGEPHVTESYIGRKIKVQDITSLRGGVMEAFTSGMPDSEEETDPNGMSGQ